MKLTATKEVILIADLKSTMKELKKSKCYYTMTDFGDTTIFLIHADSEDVLEQVRLNDFLISSARD